MSAKQKDRLVKCPYCEEKLYKSKSVQHKNGRYFHPECFEKNKGESDHYRELIEYVCNLYKIKRPTGMMLQQIKRFKEEYDYKDKGMELTLRYFYDILGNKVRENDGLGIIPWVYEDAARQFIKQKEIDKSANDPKNYESKKLVRYIDVNEKEKKGLIDIESI